MDSPRNIVMFKWMLDGYTDAMARFDIAEKTPDAQATYQALFEAMNWAVALDDRIGTDFIPDGKPLGWKWRERIGHGAEIMGGVRFARNSVHHQWSDAVEFKGGSAMLPKPLPAPFHEWVWRPADELPPPPPDKQPIPEMKRIYETQMEGRPVRICMDVLNGAFYTLHFMLEPHTFRADHSAWDDPPAFDDEPFSVEELGVLPDE